METGTGTHRAKTTPRWQGRHQTCYVVLDDSLVDAARVFLDDCRRQRTWGLRTRRAWRWSRDITVVPLLRRARYKEFPTQRFIEYFAQLIAERRPCDVCCLGQGGKFRLQELISLESFVDPGRTAYANALRLRNHLIDQLALPRNKTNALLAAPHSEERPYVTRRVLATPAVRQAVAAAGGTDEVEQEAERYAEEIVCDRHFAMCSFFVPRFDRGFRRLFERIDLGGAEQLRELDEQYQIVYLPTHRSHADFIMLPTVLALRGVESPIIAASNHLNFFPVNWLIKHISASFIHRKKMPPLYNAVLIEYYKYLALTGQSHMVFIEGTRSKTGETLRPKAGLVSQYIQAHLQTKDQSKPVAFLPVNITYDYVLEADSYFAHLLRHRANYPAHYEAVIKAAYTHYKRGRHRGKAGGGMRLLRWLLTLSPRGRAKIVFGRPIRLDEILAEHCPDWADRERLGEEGLPPDWQREVASIICRKATVELNHITSVSSTSLVSMALLAGDGIMSKAQLKDFLRRATLFLQNNRYFDRVTLPHPEDLDPEGIPFVTRERPGESDPSPRLAEAPGEGEQSFVLAPLDHLRATMYRNNIIHLFVVPAFIARALLKKGRVTAADLQRALTPGFADFGAYYHLAEECDDDAASRVVTENLQAMAAAGYLTLTQGADGLAASPCSSAVESLSFLANIGPVGQFLEQDQPLPEVFPGEVASRSRRTRAH